MKLLFSAAEIYPYSKTGGLADVAHALPKALTHFCDVTAVTPLYRFIDRAEYHIHPTGRELLLDFGGQEYEVTVWEKREEGLHTLFLYHPLLCERDHPYGPPGGAYSDNDLRFAIFCHAVAKLAINFDLVHLNDWHTALAAVFIKDRGVKVKTLFTIHNLAYQGIFDATSMERIGLDPRHFTMEDMEFYGRINWMKGAIAHSDCVTTVSPTYAKEIQTPQFGCGLEGFLHKHADKLVGILNGIDTDFFDPSTDPVLPERYDATVLSGKSICKKSMLEELDICEYEKPFFIFIGRFVEQKGIDLILDTLDTLAERPMSLMILGEGDAKFGEAMKRAAANYPNVRTFLGYDERLSHRLYAAADFLLMPSRFEPCGLNQMIAMRYGTLPIVHAVGGLKDTVHDFKQSKACGIGISFEKERLDALIEAIDRALALYKDRKQMDTLRKFDMACDFSIERCAKSYWKLYKALSREAAPQ